MLKNQAYQMGDNTKTIGGVTTTLALGFLGYILATTTVVGELSPLNVAVVACVNLLGGIATFCGSLIAYFFNGTAGEAFPQICSIITILGVKFIFNEIWGKKMTIFQCTLISTITMSVFGVGVLFISSFEILSFVLNIAQAILCGCTAYFIITVFNSIKHNKAIPISGLEGASLGVLYVLVLATLTSLDVFSFNIGRVVGIFVLLLAIKKYRHIGGAICGALTSCGIILCSSELGQSTMLLACAGLIAGLFVDFGGFAIVIAFISANIISLIAIGVTQDTYLMILDVVIATIAFVIVPSSLWTKALNYIGGTNYYGETIVQNAEERLKFASKTIRDVNESISNISLVMEKNNTKQDIDTKVCEKVCKNCKNNLYCWEQNFDATNKGFIKIKKALDLDGNVTCDSFPSELNYCVKKNLLENEFNTLYNEINYQNKLGQKLKEMRNMLSDQFTAMEEMLLELSSQISNYENPDPVLAKKITTYFFKSGITNSKVSVYLNKYGKLSIEIFVPKLSEFNGLKLCNHISDLVERELELPTYSTVKGLTKIELWEKPKYNIDMAASQIPGKETEITGDSYEMFLDNQEAYVVLSDGMGSGKRAHLDSLMTSSLLSRLIRAGVGYSSAIRLLNSSMRVKTWDESFATIDISKVNLYDGTLNVIKAGASATFLIRGSQLKKIEGISLPIGILQDVKPVKYSFKLKPHDVIITTSDGVTEECLDAIKEIVVLNKRLSAEELSEKAIECAKTALKEIHGDDITIIISKINVN